MVLRGSKTAPDSMQDALATRAKELEAKWDKGSDSPNLTSNGQQGLERVCRQLIAGGAAGAIARTVVAPLDRVKIMMQTQRLLLRQQAASQVAQMHTAAAAASVAPFVAPIAAVASSSTSASPNASFVRLNAVHSTSTAAVAPSTSLFADSSRVTRNLHVSSTRPAAAGSILRSATTFPTGTFDYLPRPSKVPAAASAAAAAPSIPLPSVSTGVASGDKYTALMQTMRVIAREEGGIMSLWRGNLTNVARVVPYSAAQFASYDYLKSRLLGVRDPLDANAAPLRMNTFQRLICGAAAGMVATALTYPLDLVRLRQTIDPNIKGARGAVRQILKESGRKGLWQGLGATMWSLTPFIAINFAVFDGMKNYTQEQAHRQTPMAKYLGLKKDTQPAWITLSLGAASGLLAQTVCYPLDTIRRRMQLPNQPYKDVWQAFGIMLRKEGAKAFYAGMGPNAAKVVPLAAIRFMSYDYISAWLNVTGKGGE